MVPLVSYSEVHNIRAQDLVNGDCLDFQAFDYFRYSPNFGYDPINGIGSEECMKLCTESSYPHAGLVNNRYCLCAPESEIQIIRSIAKVTAELCKQNDEYLTYYKTKPKNSIKNLSIKSDKDVTNLDEEVKFDLTSEGQDVEYSVDFGDGSDPTEWSTANTMKHRYYMTGKFKATIYARQAHSRQYVVHDFTNILVQGEIQTENVQMICPPVVEPGDVSVCNVTITMGTSLQMKMDFGDGISTTLTNIPDVPIKPVGVPIPQEMTSEIVITKDPEKDLKPFEIIIIPVPCGTLDLLGSIIAVEGFGGTAGQMHVYILRKICPDDVDCTGMSLTCNDGVLCTPAKSCSNDCNPFYTSKNQYKMIKRFELTITEGQFHLVSRSSFRLFSDDLIAIKMTTAHLAYRKLRPNEQPDFKVEMEGDSMTTFDAQKFQPIPERKHFIRLIVSEPLTFAMPHVYETGGNFMVKFGVKNEFSEQEIRKDAYVSIQSTISKMRLLVSPGNAAVGQRVDINVQLSKGSNVKLDWNFGDGNQTLDQIPVIRSNQKFTKSYIYQAPGVYTIEVSATNMQGNTSEKHEIIVENPVMKFWKFITDSPKLIPDPVKFILSYPEENILPTNATFFLNFGDGKRHIWRIPEDREEFTGEYVIKHVYEKSGIYNVDVEISNIVSRLKKKYIVDVLRKISGLKVNSFAKVIPRTESLTVTSKSTELLPSNTEMKFKIEIENGDVEYYLVHLNNEFYKNITVPEVMVTFEEPGIYNLTFNAFNHIQNLTSSVEKIIEILDPIVGLEITDISNDTMEPDIKRLIVNIQNLGTNSCLLIDWGDKATDDLYTFGEKEHCKELFGEVKGEHNTTLRNKFELEHRYAKPRDYLIKFTLMNKLSKIVRDMFVTVLEIDCKPPLIDIKNQITYWKQAVKVWRSKPIQLYSRTSVDCNATTTVTRQWNAYLLDPNTGVSKSAINLTSLDSASKSFLYVPSFYLKPGFYMFEYAVNMTSPNPHPVLPFYSTGVTYVKIVPSPIVARLTEGAQSRVIRGWGQKVRFAPRMASIDPDDETNKFFEVKWYCRRLPDESINNLLPDERQNFSTPIFDRTNIDEEWGDDDGGGCFGHGPGRINITADEVEWNTTVFRRPEVTYEIVVQIIPPDREPSWGALQLVLLKSKPPSVVVQCQTKPLCYPHYPIGQKINPVRVGLEGKCSESCEGELKYTWNIFGIDNNTEIALPEAKKYVVGFSEPKMALGVEFFQEYYPRFKDFFVRLSVKNELSLTGDSDIFLHINQPPEGGECMLKNRNEVRALLDRVYVKCSMWIDPEERPIEYYAFWVRNLEDNTLSFLMYGPDRDVQLILPYGNFTLGADIKDKEGALTRVEITNISTILPTLDEYDDFMNSKTLDNTDASGDQAVMSMVAQALSSLMNINFGRKANGTTTTTTTTTTTANPDYLDESELERRAIIKARMVKSVSAMMNVDTLNSLEQVGSALTALAGKGQGVDNDAKEVIIKLLNKTVSMASTLQVESPQQLMDFCRFAVGTMGGIVNRMTEQIVSGVVLPTDAQKAWSLDYKVEVPDVDDEPDYIMDAKTSVEDALKKAVIKAERQAAELQIRQMIQLTIELVLSILKNIVVGEKPIEFESPSGLTMTIAMYPKGGISNREIKHGESIYVFPHVCDILARYDCFGNETLGVLAVSWPSILESYGNSVDLLSEDTKTLQLLVINETLDIIDVRNTTNPFSIIVPRKTQSAEADALGEENTLPEPTYVVPKLKFYESMIYHQVLIEKSDSAVNIEISPQNNDSEVLLYLKFREKPLFDYYDMLIPLNAISGSYKNGTFDIFLSNKIIRNQTGFLYVGVVEVDKATLKASPEAYILDEIIINEDWQTNYTITNYTLPGAVRDYSTNYSMRIYTSGCYFYDYHLKIWSADGCLVESANYAMTHCKCNHLTSFGSGFFIMPNSIDFSYVFANAGFTDNVTIYMTIIVTLTLYVLLMIWARKEDRNDLEKLGSTPLPDNEIGAKYLYEILVYTGDKDGAATDSKISFVLSGDDEETGVRKLEDPYRPAFRRADTNSFVMAVPKRLGRLNYIRIWHDNSGEGKFRSWFLSFIVVRDVHTGEKYEFICNKWLAVEKDDGLVDRLLPVAGRDEATEFSHLFHQTSQKNLADGHLWFSIFMRPPRSRFTRMQRVSCCMALLYLSMLVNAMWYERVPSKPAGSAIEFGPFSLSPEQIGVGFMSNLLVFPPTFLIILLFRKSRLRKLRPSRITEAIKKQKVQLDQLRGVKASLSKQSSRDNAITFQQNSSKKKKQRFTLPHYCQYIAWFLCAFAILVAIFFLWAYGIQFGEEKTRKWITSLMVSFFASILVTQPIKVFLTAIFLSTIFKSPDVDIDDSDEDEDDLDMSILSHDEEWLHDSMQNKQRSKMYRSPNSNFLEKIKLQRLKELKMMIILKDIFSYLCFLWILSVISYGNRDPTAYLMKETMVKTLIDGSNDGTKYMEVKTAEDMWKWVDKTLVPTVLIGDWYNGFKPLGLRGFMNDRVNRMMGYGILRQIRVRPSTCLPEQHFQKVIQRCRAFSNVIHEDSMSYLPGWLGESVQSYVNESIPRSKAGFLNPSKSKKDEWNHRTASELDGLPFIGKLDVYSGGGYVIPLKGSREELREKIDHLKSLNWIDERTRAIIAEFAVYNAQANLFGIASCVFEFLPGGGIIPNYRIDVIRLMRYHQGFGLFVILCEIFYISFIVYFSIREFKAWKVQGAAYLGSYWNLAELFVIFLSYAAFGLYVYRLILTNEILNIFNQTHGNGYIKLQYVSAVDELFGYIIAFIVFVAILKFIKLLRFNKRMGILYSTLSQCSKDLKSFSIVFCIVFFAFVQMFYIMFGLTMKEYSSFVNAAESTFGMVTGKFDFESMVMAAPLLGPLVFFIFVLVATIVLVNIFLTLIISAFETVKHDVMKQDNEYEIVDFMKKKIQSMLGLYRFVHEPEEAIDERERELKIIEEKIALLPAQVENMLIHLNKNVYKGQLNLRSFGNSIDGDNITGSFSSVTLNGESTGRSAPSNGKKNRNGRRSGKKSSMNRNETIHDNAPKLAFLNWNEVID